MYRSAISRTPQQFIDASHPAGCRTLFGPAAGPTQAGTLHVPLGYTGETRAFGTDMAKPIIQALRSGEYHNSQTNTIWGSARQHLRPAAERAVPDRRARSECSPSGPDYNANCTVASPVAANGATSGQSLRSQVAAFQIGDGEFISLPGEVFPFTFLRGFLGPQDMPDPTAPLPPWLLPHMQAPFRFIDGLGEDMLGYIFPAGNAVGIPTAANLDPSGDDRFGCHHSDDSESTSADAANIIGDALVRVLDRHGRAERIVRGRYILPSGERSRDPLGGPEIKCNVDQTFHYAGRAVGVQLAGGQVVHPRLWMSLSGLPQRRPDRDTRGYFDARGRRVWLDVYPSIG